MELKPLKRAYEVDEAINTDESCIVIVRFGRQKADVNRINEVDGWLKSLDPGKYSSVGIKVYTVEMKAVPELVARYKLMDPVTVLFFRDNIQGGRLQGSDINEQKIDEVIKKLATKQKKDKSYSGPSTPAATKSSDTRTATNSKKREMPADNMVAWIREWLKNLNNK